MTPLEIFKNSNFLWGQDIVEWKIRSRDLVWYLKQDFAKGRRFLQKVKKWKCFGRRVEWISGTPTHHTLGSGGGAFSRRKLWDLGAKPPAAKRSFVSFWKNKPFFCNWTKFRRFSETFKKTRFLTFESQLKKLNRSILHSSPPPLTCRPKCRMGKTLRF